MALYPSGKGRVCKTLIQRFESARRLCVAQVVEMVDTRDLKSLGLFVRAGSSPALGTYFLLNAVLLRLFIIFVDSISLSI